MLSSTVWNRNQEAMKPLVSTVIRQAFARVHFHRMWSQLHSSLHMQLECPWTSQWRLLIPFAERKQVMMRSPTFPCRYRMVPTSSLNSHFDFTKIGQVLFDLSLQRANPEKFHLMNSEQNIIHYCFEHSWAWNLTWCWWCCWNLIAFWMLLHFEVPLLLEHRSYLVYSGLWEQVTCRGRQYNDGP